MTYEDALRLKPRLMKRLSIGGLDACWEWKGAKSRGYGQIWNKDRNAQVPRVAYTLWRGEIPTGLEPDHLCRNHACANPRHLELVTGRENVLRGIGPTAINARKTHCKRGHEFTPENIYRRPGAPEGRECLTCKRFYHRKAVPKGEDASPARSRSH